MNLNKDRPDLSIFISLQNNQLSFLVDGDPRKGLNHKHFGPLQLCRQPSLYFQDFLEYLDDQAKEYNANPSMTTVFESLALNLFEEVLPKDLQTLLWDLRHEPLSLRIDSEEPWIPWELCKLQGRDDHGQLVEGGYLCEVFDVTRWFAGVPSTNTFTLRYMAVLAPNVSELSEAQAEIDDIQNLLKDTTEVSILNAELDVVNDAMRQGLFDAWHLASHGRKPGQSGISTATIELDDAQLLRPDSITGATRTMLDAKPLVFLNNCYSGRSDYSITKQNGWASRLIHGGDRGQHASAVIGTLWPVDDHAARTFAVAFYKHLLQNLPLARAVRLARLETAKLGGSSWLAYMVYGDPLAKLHDEIDWSTWWHHAQETAGTQWHSLILPVLLVFCAVAEPISLDMAAVFTGITPRKKLLEAIEFWSNFTELSGFNVNNRYQIKQAGLLNFIKEKHAEPNSSVDLEAVHDRIAMVLSKSLSN